MTFLTGIIQLKHTGILFNLNLSLPSLFFLPAAAKTQKPKKGKKAELGGFQQAEEILDEFASGKKGMNFVHGGAV